MTLQQLHAYLQPNQRMVLQFGHAPMVSKQQWSNHKNKTAQEKGMQPDRTFNKASWLQDYPDAEVHSDCNKTKNTQKHRGTVWKKFQIIREERKF